MSEIMRIHLRGGQVVEKEVEHWEVRKSTTTGDLLGIEWTGPAGSDDRMPYVRPDAIDAVTITPKGRGK
jgi:hypothetical protein